MREQRNRELSEQIARMERQQAALVRLARRELAGTSETSTLLRDLTEVASRTMEVERASVWLLSPDRQQLRLVDLFEQSAHRHSTGVVLSATDYPRYFDALESGRAIDADVACRDPRTSEFESGYLEPLGITSMLDATVRDGGRVIGVVCHEHIGAPRSWSGDEIAFAAALGDQVALILSTADRLRLEQERERMRLELVHTQRLESLGTLAAGVAHEISNPLAYIATNLDFVATRLDRADDPAVVREIRRATREAQLGADRVRRIVSDLTRFARRDQRDPVPVDVRAVLDTAVSMAWGEIRHRARLVRDYVAPALVLAEEDRLVQVFLNLLLNAAHAIEEGRLEGNEIRLRTREDGERLVIDVVDTGSGIPPEALGRVFDPFFTTKPVGSGTGLGLSICHTIVSSLGGTMEVDSRVGQGTTFRVILPIHCQVAPQVESARVPIGSRRARILMIDDEPYFLSAMERTMEGEHQLFIMTSAREALGVIASGQEFDLILCDLMMAEMSGMDFHRALLQQSPEVASRVVFVTGGAFTPRARAFLQTVLNRCVEKPIDRETIAELVRELDQRQGEAALREPAPESGLSPVLPTR